jgi:tRNA1(Val) A37 N6-methylase TrmN6
VSVLTENALLGGRVRLRQPVEGYRAAIDPVLLAAAVPARPGDLVLDAGVGAGAASLCLAVRVPECRIVGIEKEPSLVALARENAALNAAAARITIIEGDVGRPPATPAPGSFDHVLANPPFLEPGGSASPHPLKDVANVERGADLAVWVGFALAMARRKGSVTFIHRADRIEALLAGLAGAAGEIAVFPLWPKAGSAAKRVIVRARKGVASPSRIAPGLVLHGADGRYTAAAEAILRDGAPLEI